ncbi:MAG: glycoside hydrolase family 3 protein [Gaiellaceae bacterium]
MTSELERLAAACVFPGFEGPAEPEWVRRWVERGLGGVVLFGWNVESAGQLRALTSSLRAERPDLLVGIDEEGGDVTRLEVATGSSYPGNAALGVVDDVSLTEQVAAAIAGDLADVGVSLNLAPVADVNTNRQNPVIGIRSFGADAALVSRHVAAAVRGFEGAGVAACAKHFPGHGDTAEDSHHELPVVESLEDEALAPFRAAIEAGVQSIMTAHIVVRSVGESPATMSRELLHELLRGNLGFDGMVMTDALEMRAIAGTVGVEEGAVRAIAAGADALCLGHDLFEESVRGVCDALVEAVRSGRLPESRLVEAAERVRRVSAWASRSESRRRPDRDVGREAAARALHVAGSGTLSRAALVVELAPEPSMAAGRMPEGPGDWFRNVVPGAELLRLHDDSVGAAVTAADGRQLVIVTRDAHRHEWERAAVEALLAAADDAIVVEVGIPGWRPAGAATYVATYGAARVNVEAAAEALYSDSHRGVEQSGSSPGS